MNDLRVKDCYPICSKQRQQNIAWSFAMEGNLINQHPGRKITCIGKNKVRVNSAISIWRNLRLKPLDDSRAISKGVQRAFGKSSPTYGWIQHAGARDRTRSLGKKRSLQFKLITPPSEQLPHRVL